MRVDERQKIDGIEYINHTVAVGVAFPSLVEAVSGGLIYKPCILAVVCVA